jgi:hypothetical protein
MNLLLLLLLPLYLTGLAPGETEALDKLDALASRITARAVFNHEPAEHVTVLLLLCRACSW